MLNVIFIIIIIVLSFLYFGKSSTTSESGSYNTDNRVYNNLDQQEDQNNSMFSKEETINRLTTTKNGDFLEEVPRIETYGTSTAFYEYYILDSIKNNNLSICEQISDISTHDLCKKLQQAWDNESSFIQAYIAFGEVEQFAKEMYSSVQSIKQWNCENSITIMSFLRCKKILQKDVDVRDLFIKYYMLQYSDPLYIRESLNWILQEWAVQEDFKKFITKTIN